MSTLLPNGIGETPGDALVLAKPLWASGQVWYVDSVTGSNAAGNRGLSKERPLATLAQAVTNASSGDLIVLLATHTEVLTATITVVERLTIIAAGANAGQPTAAVGFNGSAQLLIQASDVELRNIKFTSRTASGANPRVAVNSPGFRMAGCRFECGANDVGAGLLLQSGANQARVRTTTFISTATSAASRPFPGMQVGSAVTDSFGGLELDTCTFDNGTTGFRHETDDADYAFYGKGIIKRLRVESGTLLRGADMYLHDESTGWVHIATATYGARVVWCPCDSADAFSYSAGGAVLAMETHIDFGWGDWEPGSNGQTSGAYQSFFHDSAPDSADANVEVDMSRFASAVAGLTRKVYLELRVLGKKTVGTATSFEVKLVNATSVADITGTVQSFAAGGGTSEVDQYYFLGPLTVGAGANDIQSGREKYALLGKWTGGTNGTTDELRLRYARFVVRYE